jgi:hypothetical protein
LQNIVKQFFLSKLELAQSYRQADSNKGTIVSCLPTSTLIAKSSHLRTEVWKKRLSLPANFVDQGLKSPNRRASKPS